MAALGLLLLFTALVCHWLLEPLLDLLTGLFNLTLLPWLPPLLLAWLLAAAAPSGRSTACRGHRGGGL